MDKKLLEELIAELEKDIVYAKERLLEKERLLRGYKEILDFKNK